VPVPAAAASYAFQLTPSLAGVADGAVNVVVRCTDVAGNVSLDHAVALKDSVVPTISFISPRPDEEIGGAFLLSGMVADAGALARVELSTDGKSFAPLEMKGAFATVIDPGTLKQVPDRITVRAVDRGVGGGGIAAAPVLLVVGIRLGCLNHALLSALAISWRGLSLAGWVANRIDPAMSEADATVSALTDRLPAPLLADFAWCGGGVPAFGANAAALAQLGFGSRASAAEVR
jgi:hypothetical protein